MERKGKKQKKKKKVMLKEGWSFIRWSLTRGSTAFKSFHFGKGLGNESGTVATQEKHSRRDWSGLIVTCSGALHSPFEVMPKRL